MRKESGGKGKECAGKSVSLYSIIEIGERKVEKWRGKGMFIIYRTLVQT